MNREEGGKGGGGGRELPNRQLTSGSRIFRAEPPSEHKGSQREDWRCVCPDSRSAAGKCEERRRKKNKRTEHRQKKQQKVRAKGGGGPVTTPRKRIQRHGGGWSRWPKGRNGGGWWGVWMLWLPSASGQHCEPVLQPGLCAAEVAPCGRREFDRDQRLYKQV